jgi:hypothetical protein
MIGIALIINGVFISKRQSDSDDIPAAGGSQIHPDPAMQKETQRLQDSEAVGYLSPVDTNELISTPSSVTDETTRHLKQPR